MDIIDIMLARAMTPQGKTETYVGKAKAAAEKAEQAKQDATAAIATVNAAAEDIADAQSAAEELLSTAQEVLETAQQAQINTLDTEDVDDEIKKLDVSINTVNGQTANTIQVITTYPDNTLNTENVTKLYKQDGENEDGTMTQKAIKTYVTTSVATKADKTYVDQQIAAIPQNGGAGGTATSVDIGEEYAGHVVIVGEDGEITAGDTTEQEIIEALIRSGSYYARNAIGLEINYKDKNFTRTQGASHLDMGNDFNNYLMYGGRKRCNVADDGTINAFYGDPTYTEDGSNGQVMIYQPKFYYQRVPLQTEILENGKAIRQESIIVSSEKQSGFKIHPLFVIDGNKELDYVLLSAYEGAVDNDKLTSINGVQPTTGITIAEAEAYANARGEGWHILNMAAVSANQMLEVVEFGTMNGQTAIESGVSNLANTANVNCSVLTGSTESLGNGTGHATTSISNNNGTEIQNTTDGTRAISYRGMENPWGNLWSMIGGINIKNDEAPLGGAPYICTDFDYDPTTIDDNYEYIGFNLPTLNRWISAMGYGLAKYDWIFLPIETDMHASSLLPIGDSIWVATTTTNVTMLARGGAYTFQDNNGPFYYASDRLPTATQYNYAARLMFIPEKNAIYTSNINKWQAHMGGD